MRTIWIAAAAAALVSGCAGRDGEALARSYDFGIDAPAAQLAAVRVGRVRATVPFDMPDMHYRLAYRNPAELFAFAQSRWAAAPAELYRKRLLRAAAAGPVRCTLEIELQEVTQVFSTKDTSEALLELRARVGDAGREVAERMFRVAQPGAGAAAPEGAAAMAKAADHSISELAVWIGSLPGCAAPR